MRDLWWRKHRILMSKRHLQGKSPDPMPPIDGTFWQHCRQVVLGNRVWQYCQKRFWVGKGGLLTALPKIHFRPAFRNNISTSENKVWQ